jgi:hypothetical protein
MDAQLEIKLIECLSLLDEGEPLDRILARYPDDAASLRPLLETATALATLRVEPAETARIASRRAFLAQAHQLRENSTRWHFWRPQRLAIALLSLVLVFASVSGTVAASATALPDEPLYSVKRTVEDARLLLSSGAERAELATSFEQRRRDEITVLLASQRAATIEFEGPIQALKPDSWIVDGLTVHLDWAPSITGTPFVGWRAHVRGRTAGGQLFATSLEIEPGSGPLPTPTASPTPRPSSTPKPSPTPRATLPPADTPIPTAAPTETPRPRPTEPQAPQEQEVEFSGVVESIGASWSVSGTRVEIDAGTEIRGTISPGDNVKVRARRLPNGQLIARRIEREDHGDSGTGSNSGNSGGADDQGGSGGNDSGGSNSGSGGGNDSGGNNNDSGGSNSGSGGSDGGNDSGGSNSGSGGSDGGNGSDDHSGGGGGDNHGGSDGGGGGNGSDGGH